MSIHEENNDSDEDTNNDEHTHLSIQQQDQGIINGTMTGEASFSGSLSGTVLTNRQITFTVQRNNGSRVTFTGTVQSDGSLSGTYSTPDEQGTWSTTP